MGKIKANYNFVLSIEMAEKILKSELSNADKQKELVNQALNENKN